VAAIARTVICQKHEAPMTQKTNNALKTGAEPRRPRVRVKLKRIDASLSRIYPPDGQGKIWWARLKKALGTSSSDFVNASLFQLQKAAQLPGLGISEIAMNASLAMIEAAEAQNEIEGALAVQMACAHTAAISVLAKFGGGGPTEARAVALASAAARLMRAADKAVRGETAKKASRRRREASRRRRRSYMPEIAHSICERLVEGESLRQICQDTSMPARSRT
jgi:terminase small subunit-like protein